MARTQQVAHENKRHKTSHKNQGKMKIAAMVKKAIGNAAESKEVLTATTNTLSNITAATQPILLVSGVAEGTDYNTRVGRSVTHKYVEVSLVITSLAALNQIGYGDAGFWSLVLDRQPNGAAPAWSDVYDTSVQNIGGVAMRNTQLYQDRFKILAHEDWLVGAANSAVAASGTASGASPYRIKRFIDLRNLKGNDAKAKFNGTGATVGSINEGALFLMIGATLANVNILSYTGQVKYRFTDM